MVLRKPLRAYAIAVAGIALLIFAFTVAQLLAESKPLLEAIALGLLWVAMFCVPVGFVVFVKIRRELANRGPTSE